MFAVNYSTLRDNMKECFDRVSDGFETMVVTRKNSNMVIMSEDSYNSLMETVYLCKFRLIWVLPQLSVSFTLRIH